MEGQLVEDLLERLKTALADRYRIEREIGSGGMATVYLADDVRHHRQVALKLLKPELCPVLGGGRFLREIHIAAGLHHPHILALHDSGEVDGLLYYVMPYVEGESLRDRLDREKQLPLDDALLIAREVADALSYAHSRDVVHRDIKPENILLEGGHALVADFGIARAITAAGGESLTATGLAVGTPLYMSPEQSAGEQVDGRSDVYSLGCVLYEMLAGEPPHTGPTAQAIIAKRLSETVPSLRVVRETVPEELDQALARALATAPADRFTTASEFADALSPRVGGPEWVTRPAGPLAVTGLYGLSALAVLAVVQFVTDWLDLPEWVLPGAVVLLLVGFPIILGAALAQRGAIRLPASTSRLFTWRRAILGGVAAFAIWGVIVTGYTLVGTWEAPISITTSNITHVTSDPGLEFQPAISPDGNEVAYVVGPIGNPRIVVRSTVDVGSGGQSRPGEEAGGIHWLPAWTPDGASLHFLACSLRAALRFGSGCDWKQVGRLGGSVRTISVPRVSSSIQSSSYAWSRDGSRVAFAMGWDSIFAYSAEGGEPELLGLQVVDPSGPHSLAWSPDGQLIAYVNGNDLWRTSANVANASIWILDANGGEPVPVTDEVHLNVSPQWLPDSRHLLFVSDRDGPRGIYVVEVGPEGPRGPPRAVPGFSDPHSISISADGRRLAYSKFTVAQNIWSIPIPRSGSVSISDAVPVTTGNQIIEQYALSPDGEWIVFDSDIRGEFDIHKMRLDGGRPQLVADITGHVFAPDWSPDGAEIAFYSGISEGIGRREVLVVSADGGTPEQLTDNPGYDTWPDWSPDGLAIAFHSQGPQGAGPIKIWILSRDSVGMPWSDPAQLTDFECERPDWAPDGASLVCNAAEVEIVRVSRDGEVISRYDPSTAGLQRFVNLQFSPDGSRIYFRATHEDGSAGVWWIPANGGDATKVVAFDDPSLTVAGTPTVGPESLYLTIAQYESDIWVMDLEW